MPADRAISLYVHFPWCVRKCPYCDFNSHPVRGEIPVAAYTQALLADLDGQLARYPGRLIESVFFGGGTPSLFPPSSVAMLIDRLGDRLTPDAEITLEANPGSAEHGDLAGFRTAGINRLSLGAQTFDDALLERLGRIHDRRAIFASYEQARRAGFSNINLDLMYGLPGQSPAGALADLETACTLAPEHLSWYQLTVEPKTEFARRPPILPAEPDLAAMEAAGYACLDEAGYYQYEVSAFARPGFRCTHNLGYWTFGDYLGVGAGAHGKVSLTAQGSPGPEIWRTAKPRQPRLYLADPVSTLRQRLEPSALPGEFMLNVLRLVDGVDSDRFQAATGCALDALEPARGELVSAGLLHPRRLAATPRGYALLDSLIERWL